MSEAGKVFCAIPGCGRVLTQLDIERSRKFKLNKACCSTDIANLLARRLKEIRDAEKEEARLLASRKQDGTERAKPVRPIELSITGLTKRLGVNRKFVETRILGYELIPVQNHLDRVTFLKRDVEIFVTEVMSDSPRIPDLTRSLLQIALKKGQVPTKEPAH